MATPIVVSNNLGEPRPLFVDVNSRFGENNRPELVSDVDAINEKIDNIIFIRPGERLFRPTFAGWIYNYLFEPVDDVTASLILVETSRIFSLWLPELTLLLQDSSVVPMGDEHGYDVSLVYQVNALSFTGNYMRQIVLGIGGV